MHPFLSRLHHDLLKHALWCVRDLQELGELAQPPGAADARALRRALLELHDGEGLPATALTVWRELREEAEAPAAALDAFEQAVAAAEAAVRALPQSAAGEELAPRVNAAVAAVLALERAFAELTRSVEQDSA